MQTLPSGATDHFSILVKLVSNLAPPVRIPWLSSAQNPSQDKANLSTAPQKMEEEIDFITTKQHEVEKETRLSATKQGELENVSHLSTQQYKMETDRGWSSTEHKPSYPQTVGSIKTLSEGRPFQRVQGSNRRETARQFPTVSGETSSSLLPVSTSTSRTQERRKRRKKSGHFDQLKQFPKLSSYLPLNVKKTRVRPKKKKKVSSLW